MSELAARSSLLPHDRAIVAVCRSGNRSGQVTEALQRQGYRIENLEGGLKAWRRAGLPLDPPHSRVA
jgi:rhodanese-related sulfurtransferase